jgi:hypothetical protein
MKKITLLALLGIFVSSCLLKNVEPPISTAYIPIYLSRNDIEKVVFTTAQPVKSPGKIYIKDNYLFVNESSKGVHVFDNKNPQNPVNIAFYAIPNNNDIAIKGAILYADNGLDLLSIDVSNPKEPKVLNRVKDIFPNQHFPPFTGVQFECVDNAKGIVVGWKKITYDDPNYRTTQFKCYR